MALSLYSATIPVWQQALGAAQGLLTKAEAFVADGSAEEEALLQSRLIEDMLPLSYQFKSCWTHSAAALEGVRKGEFSPERTPPPGSFAGLRELLGTAERTCSEVTEQELEELQENDLLFSIGDNFRLSFSVKDFLLSFTNPNIHFHLATAYGILRKEGVAIGKRDYLGALRVKQP